MFFLHPFWFNLKPLLEIWSSLFIREWDYKINCWIQSLHTQKKTFSKFIAEIKQGMMSFQRLIESM
jgi:hypothetical protein